MNLNRIKKIHESQTAPITTHLTLSPNLKEFLSTYSKLQKKYFDSSDTTISDLIRCLSIIRVELLQNPVLYSENPNLQNFLEEFMLREVNLSQQLDAADLEDLSVIRRSLLAVVSQENIFLQKFLKIVRSLNSQEIYVVVRSQRICATANAGLKQISSSIRTIMPGEVALIDSDSFSLVYIGAPEQFVNLERQISSVCTNEIHFICVHSSINSIDGILGSAAISNYSRIVNQEFSEKHDYIEEIQAFPSESYSDETLSRALLLDKIDSADAFDSDLIDCFAFALAEDHVIFIPIPGAMSQQVSIEALVPGEPINSRVQRISVLEVGTDSIFLVRRGSTTTLALRPIADEIMGPKWKEYRDAQLLWKGVLTERIKSQGLEQVSSELRKLGIPNPYPTFWSNPLRMRPKSDFNFAVLLDYLGLSAQKQLIFIAANAISSAHIKAGHKFLNILQEVFESVDPSEIYQNGIVDKGITSDASIATLTAIVCLAKLPGIHKVPEDQVRKLIKMNPGENNG